MKPEDIPFEVVLFHDVSCIFDSVCSVCRDSRNEKVWFLACHNYIVNTQPTFVLLVGVPGLVVHLCCHIRHQSQKLLISGFW